MTVRESDLRRRERIRSFFASVKRSLMKRRRDRRFLWRIAVILLCVATVFVSTVGIYKRCAPIALGALENTVSAWLEEIVNETVRGELESKKYRWDDFCIKNIGADGSVSSISIDTSKVSVLCSDLVSQINKEIRSRGHVTIRIPIGNAIAPKYLSGRGFKVKIRAFPYVSVSASVTSDIKEAGINQILHSMNVCVRSSVVAVCMSDSVSFVNETKVMIAESLVVGNIPIVT